jgi:hypothetical protein
VADHTIYVDCDSGRIVTSDTDSTIKSPPRFAFGDTLGLSVYLLEGYSFGSSYDVIPTDSLAIEVRLLDGRLSDSTPVEDVLAYQGTWTAYDGLYFQADLALNTEEIETALGATANSFDATFEIKILDGGTPRTVLQQAVKIWRASDPNSVMPVATPTPLSAEAAAATYVRLVDETNPIYLMNSTSGVRCKLWIDTDGTFHADPVT